MTPRILVALAWVGLLGGCAVGPTHPALQDQPL